MLINLSYLSTLVAFSIKLCITPLLLSPRTANSQFMYSIYPLYSNIHPSPWDTLLFSQRQIIYPYLFNSLSNSMIGSTVLFSFNTSDHSTAIPTCIIEYCCCQSNWEYKLKDDQKLGSFWGSRVPPGPCFLTLLGVKGQMGVHNKIFTLQPTKKSARNTIT